MAGTTGPISSGLGGARRKANRLRVGIATSPPLISSWIWRRTCGPGTKADSACSRELSTGTGAFWVASISWTASPFLCANPPVVAECASCATREPTSATPTFRGYPRQAGTSASNCTPSHTTAASSWESSSHPLVYRLVERYQTQDAPFQPDPGGLPDCLNQSDNPIPGFTYGPSVTVPQDAGCSAPSDLRRGQ